MFALYLTLIISTLTSAFLEQDVQIPASDKSNNLTATLDDAKNLNTVIADTTKNFNPAFEYATDTQAVLKLRMPNVTTHRDNEYLVTPVKVNYEDAYIVGYEPHCSSKTVHHVLVYGCSAPARTDQKYWNVGDMGGLCSWDSDVNTILWAWALDAPEFKLPSGVGFHIGRNAKINYIVLEIHYKNVISTPDASGINVILTTQIPPKLAGIYLFATGGTIIRPNKEVHGDTSCNYTSGDILTPFAFRTHTHKLGRQVSAWRQRGDQWELIGTGDPRKPQMFYLIEGEQYPIRQGDVLHARCVFDGSATNHTVFIGSTGKDEMCNFYMMYYMNNSQFKLHTGCFEEKSFVVPPDAQVNVTSQKSVGTSQNSGGSPQTNSTNSSENTSKQTPAKAANSSVPKFTLDKNWTSPLLTNMGQVGGLSHSEEDLVVFHRGGNDWSAKQWFDSNNQVLVRESVIEEDTIFFLCPETGAIRKSFGSGMFIMPHGIYLDQHENVFVTDVALHQVIKFDKNNTKTPSLVLGEKFIPGSDASHFCKPTNVVVDKSGNIYVSDGYCNSRVVKFTSDGKYLASFGKASFTPGIPGGLNLVHDLTINHEEEVIYVADRENGQVHVMWYNGTFSAVYRDRAYGNVYGVEYSPDMDFIIAVNISSPTSPSKVFMLDPKTGNVLQTFPEKDVLNIPHTVTYVKNSSIFVGEIAEPFNILRIYKENVSSYEQRDELGFFITLTDNIPKSFIILVMALAIIPITYLLVVIICRYSNRKKAAKFDKNGFQKLLRDYDSSDDEEDLVFKNSQVFR